MRRVNEAMRQVLSEAVPTLKDPRIGFVTVTGVETTTDLERATVWVSVLGPRRQPAGDARGADGSGGNPPGTRQPGAAPAPDPQLTFAYDPSVERGVRMTQLIDELAPKRR